MGYSTVEEVRDLLKGWQEDVGDYDNTASKLSDTQIEYEISNADSQIDLGLRERGLRTPLSDPVPSIIKTLSKDIAAYLADLAYRGSNANAAEDAPFRLRYERARQILRQIVENRYPLFNEPDDVVKDEEASGVFNFYPGTVLKDEEVFPRGVDFFPGGAEYSRTTQIPYRYGYDPDRG